MTDVSNCKVIRTTQVLDMLGVSRVTLYRWVQAGQFPKPLAANGRAFGYRLSEIEGWMNAQQK
jgi:prophage regulatory protein